MKKRLIPVSVLVALALALVSARADVLVSDAFDYATGATLQGKNGGTGWSYGWNISGSGTAIAANADLSAGTPENYGYTVAANAADLTPSGNTESIYRSLPFNIDLNADGTYYFSFVFARVDTDASATSGENVLFSLRSSGTQIVNFGFNSSEQIMVRNFTAGGGSTTNSAVTYNVSSSLANLSSYLVVGKIVTSADGTDSFYLSLYDAGDTLTGEPLTWDASLLDQDLTQTLNGIWLLGEQSTGSVYFDNLVIGETFADVTALVPEPASSGIAAGIAALALAAGAARRRKATRRCAAN